MKLCVLVVTVLMAGLVVPTQAQDASKAGEDIGMKWVAAYDAGDAGAPGWTTPTPGWTTPTPGVRAGRAAPTAQATARAQPAQPAA